MKQVIFLFFFLNSEKVVAQKLLPMPINAQPGKGDVDTVLFKQIINIKALNKIAFEVPPQYEKIFRKTNPNAIYSEWREVMCSDDGNRISVYEIQNALKKRGYYSSKIDNIFGKKTKNACIRFQKDNNLSTGNLNIETLQALGFYKNQND